MTAIDRLEKLQYESPKKKLFTLEFDALVRSGGKKVGINEFPDQNVTNEQELGNIANRFPLECYISGVDYDREADRFFKALEENGIGTLDHPRWGSYDVIPITYSQREEWVNGIGRAMFTIEFIRYYPEASSFLAILLTPFEIAELIIEGMDKVLSLETAARRIGRNIRRQIGTTQSEINRIKNRTNDVLANFKRENKNFGDRTKELADRINEQEKKITRSIDTLAANPVQLVTELNTLFSLPSKIESSIRAKLDGYTNIFNSISEQFTLPGATFTDYEAAIQAYIGTAAMLSLTQCTTAGIIKTRNEAVQIADQLFTNSVSMKTIFDRAESKSGLIDYEIYRNTQKLVTTCQKLLIDQALNLPSERTEVLTGDISPLKFCYERLGNIALVDNFIEYNNLKGDDIILMKAGQTVRYIPNV